MLKELESLSFMTIFAKGEQTKLHILDPRYWQMMSKLETNEIEFINCIYLDMRKSNIALEAYEKMLDLPFKVLLSEEKRKRFLDVLITSIREVEGGVMKVKHYEGEDRLSYKRGVYGEVVNLINSKLEDNDEMIIKLDKNNKQ